ALHSFLEVRDSEPSARELNEQQLQAYVGSYTTQLADTELYVRNGVLTMQLTPKGGFPDKHTPPSAPTPPPVRLAFIGDDQVLALDAPLKEMRGEFLRGDDGAIAWFRFGGRIGKRE
ncbi:MAG: hypothetical protein LC737_10890, partial [Chloroflexi bacterium]|nr:hypothetical protein [Chloroflexota bacterium]